MHREDEQGILGRNSKIVDFLEPFQNIFGMKIQIFTNLKKKKI